MMLQRLYELIERESVGEHGHCTIEIRRLLQAMATGRAIVRRQGTHRATCRSQIGQISITCGAQYAIAAGYAAQKTGLRGQGLPQFCADVQKMTSQN